MPPHTRLIISILAVVSIVSVVAVLVAMGIHASNARELNQNEQIEKLKRPLKRSRRDYIECRKSFSFSSHVSRLTMPVMRVCEEDKSGPHQHQIKVNPASSNRTSRKVNPSM